MKIHLTHPIVAVLLTGVSLGIWWQTSGATSYQDHAFVEALQRNEITKARVLLRERYDWQDIVARLDRLGDKQLYSRALDALTTYSSTRPEGCSFSEKCFAADQYTASYPYLDLEMIAQLVSRGARPTFRHLTVALDNDKTHIALYLLQKGAPARGNKGEGNPLTRAVSKGDISLARALIQYGADINAPDDRLDHWKSRPLEAASAYGAQEMVRLLLNQGADPRLPSLVPDSENRPIWEMFRDAARVKDNDGKLYEEPVATWRLIKPAVETLIGHHIAD